MAKARVLDGFVKALIAFYAVYLIVAIARAGYETGQMLAGKTTLAEAVSRFDIAGVGLVSAGLVLMIAMRKARRTQD